MFPEKRDCRLRKLCAKMKENENTEIGLLALYYWLNQHGQRKSYTWEGYNEMLKAYPIAPAKIYVSVYAR